MSRTGYAKLSNEFAYASGIIGNLMEESARIAQKRSE